IEEEVLVSRKTTREVAEIIKAKEEQLWGSNPPAQLTRVADTDKTRILDFATEHHLSFSEPLKPNKESTINALRMFIAAGKLVIHPRCERLAQQLSGAVWNKSRTQFERNDVHGHYDLVDALAYIIPNINRTRNYTPNKYAGLSRQDWYIPDLPTSHEGIGSIIRWFKP
ncbi:MAG: hypothetical protein KDA17_08335, partial [Candidatus Saccharibacteria bacterium]|nr:hypothetical protein [Candidatus Saccharibacteria bacterium]